MLLIIPLQSYHVLIHEVCLFFFQLYNGEFIPMKIVSLSFLDFWIKRRSKIKHTSWPFCRNLNQLKNGKKNRTGYSFQRKKRCFVLSEGNTQKNFKNTSGFTEAFIQGSDNFKTSALSHHDKSCRCKLLTKVNILKS